jgi:hypothetical protein
MLPAGIPDGVEAGVILVAVAHQRVQLRLHFARLALRAAKTLCGGVHIVLGEAD